MKWYTNIAFTRKISFVKMISFHDFFLIHNCLLWLVKNARREKVKVVFFSMNLFTYSFWWSMLIPSCQCNLRKPLFLLSFHLQKYCWAFKSTSTMVRRCKKRWDFFYGKTFSQKLITYTNENSSCVCVSLIWDFLTFI